MRSSILRIELLLASMLPVTAIFIVGVVGMRQNDQTDVGPFLFVLFACAIAVFGAEIALISFMQRATKKQYAQLIEVCQAYMAGQRERRAPLLGDNALVALAHTLNALLDSANGSIQQAQRASNAGSLAQQRNASIANFQLPEESLGYASMADFSTPTHPQPPPPPTIAAAPLQPLAAEASMGMSMSPSLKQSAQQYPRRHRLLLVLGSVLLVILLVTGGIVAAFARSAPGRTGSQQMAGASGTAQSTATSGTTKNNQGHPTATPTPVSRAAAIASAGPDQLYNVVTSVSPTWQDPLSSQDNNNWTVSENCAFSGGVYHITSTTTKTVKTCYADNTNFCNMAFQVQITNFSGEGGGITYRASNNGTKRKGYTFTLKPEGAYDLLASGVNLIPYTRTSSPAVHTGYNVSNVVTVIARGSNFYFYVNQQFLVSASDSSLTCGKIALIVLDWTSLASASFSDVKVWTF